MKKSTWTNNDYLKLEKNVSNAVKTELDLGFVAYTLEKENHVHLSLHNWFVILEKKFSLAFIFFFKFIFKVKP